jgi:hypothetical protein
MLVYLVDEAKASTAVEQALGGITVYRWERLTPLFSRPTGVSFGPTPLLTGTDFVKGFVLGGGLTVTTQKLGN